MEIQELDHCLSLVRQLDRNVGVFFEERGHLVPESRYARPFADEEEFGTLCRTMSNGDISV